MIRELFLGTSKPRTDALGKELFDPAFFEGKKTVEMPTTPIGQHLNSLLHAEMTRRQVTERLDTLIELQKEQLETQKAILAALQAGRP